MRQFLRRAFTRSGLFWTITASIVLLVVVGGWLLTDPATPHNEALKTGGLAGGAVVALYALWLNDRRRKVEEGRQDTEKKRHELEADRAEQDRTRVADERFAKAVELLGHNADQVRVGALHALAGLARSRGEYRQTVLDVLCSYLRRPFDHPRYEENVDRHDRQNVRGSAEEEQELTVRLTAQRLIVALLPRVKPEGHVPEDVPSYDLDLTGATLEYFDLSRRQVGELLLRYASLQSSTSFSGAVFTGDVYLTSAGTRGGRLIGAFRCKGTTFAARAWFSGTHFAEVADFRNTKFAGRTTFKDAAFTGESVFAGVRATSELSLDRARFDGPADLTFAEVPADFRPKNTVVRTDYDVTLPEGWELKPLSNGEARVVLTLS